MLINLTDVFSVEGKDREERFDFELHEVSYM